MIATSRRVSASPCRAPAPLPPPERRIAGLLACIDHLQARLDVLDDEARALRREADTARQALADLLKKSLKEDRNE